MDLTLTNLAFNFDNDGATVSVSLSYSGEKDGSFINGAIVLTQADLDKDSTFDDLNKKQLNALGRKKFADLVTVKEA